MTRMTRMTNSSSAASAAEELLRERDRVVRRLGSMALDAMPTDRVHAAVQQLADLITEPSSRRPVPQLAPYAAGDQVTVLTAEVLGAATDLAAGAGLSDEAAAALLSRATALLVDLRRDLAAR